MIRLTLLLLAAIFVTMVLAGRGPDPRGTVGGTRNVAASRAEPVPEELVPQPNRLDLADERGAIERALAASEAPPEAPPPPEDGEEAAPVAEGPPLRSVSGNRVNMRSGPGTAYDVIGQLQEGERVAVLDDPGDGWVEVEVSTTGTQGWMADFLLAE
ncbi:SH3 domain-containing protein [Palleronia aestuarii]|uniref:SH3 domain-containing protein n=1 Tax=Palleronia aestuarii TaxID=568105 RepID=A0A2W7NEU3_9RHOB|nr:SH3 domain-containing protein [Palleronia aestuarii]PZX16657.1 SH3 domain-containing protein [Palleronia aestuarii]